MRQIFIGIVFFFLRYTPGYAQFSTTIDIRYSKQVSDSFEIYISVPPTFNAKERYNVVYYCDANLKSGKHLRELLSGGTFDVHLQHSIFIGIGHIGNFHVLRRRDFILPDINHTDTVAQHKNYGQITNFYAFLTKELIPAINTKFKTNTGNNSIIGHSLGGLFAFYCFFRSDHVFSRYFALSPSLWVDQYAIYRFNKIPASLPGKKYLYFVSGSRETLNKVLHGTNEAKIFLDKMNYGNLKYDYDIWPGETHNSEVPLSLKKILSEKL